MRYNNKYNGEYNYNGRVEYKYNYPYLPLPYITYLTDIYIISPSIISILSALYYATWAYPMASLGHGIYKGMYSIMRGIVCINIEVNVIISNTPFISLLNFYFNIYLPLDYITLYSII